MPSFVLFTTTPEISKCDHNNQTLLLNKVIERDTIYRTYGSRAALTEVEVGSTLRSTQFLFPRQVPRDPGVEAPQSLQAQVEPCAG